MAVSLPSSAGVGGGVGGALGILAVIFMPPSVFIFTPETASIATAALGVVFSYLVKFLPKPPAG